MARIRTVKPELWTSEQFVECSANARLLFIGLFNFVDDGGIHPLKPMRIKMQIFPADGFSKADMAAMIGELESADLIETYAVDGAEYLMITGFSKHQRIDQPTYKHPLPSGEIPQNVRRSFAEYSANVHPRNGKEGKGKDSNKGSGKPNAPAKKRATALPDDFTPTDNNRQVAADMGVSLPDELAKFKDHHTAKGSTYKDWNAALNTWLRNARDFKRGGAPFQQATNNNNLKEFRG